MNKSRYDVGLLSSRCLLAAKRHRGGMTIGSSVSYLSDTVFA
ncbi:hypothetical protein [Wolbachia endosymbiont of Aedes albopictus]|nr:hypothetical protein [Wolbachia endosymbiont of Aedes albopictus]UVW84258.1 hypothetical protein NHG98_01975 [Wolbachia endosymbiont of Aedes albopictus]